jgi:hypothetical protein
MNIDEYTLIVGDKFRSGCPGGMCQRGRDAGFSQAHDKGVDFFAVHQLSPSKIKKNIISYNMQFDAYLS